MKRRLARLLVGIAVAGASALLSAPAEAHVGSPDTVADGRAGPYHLLATIRPPDVIPGVARIELRALDGDVARISVVPLPMRGPGVSSPPTADVARRSAGDPAVFTSTLWLMQTGAWQVRITAEGARGAGVLAVPVPALSRGVRPMSPLLGAMLVAFLGLLVLGAVAIVGASVREGDLDVGGVPDGRRRARYGDFSATGIRARRAPRDDETDPARAWTRRQGVAQMSARGISTWAGSRTAGAARGGGWRWR